MRVEYASAALKRCAVSFDEGTRKWGKAVARKFIQRIGEVQAAPSLQDLRQSRAMHFHKLHGFNPPRFGILIHDRWRMEFIISPDKQVITVQEVSNHYGD